MLKSFSHANEKKTENDVLSVELFIVKKQFEISKYFNLLEPKYLRGLLWKICSTRPQKFGELKGNSTKKHA